MHSGHLNPGLVDYQTTEKIPLHLHLQVGGEQLLRRSPGLHGQRALIRERTQESIEHLRATGGDLGGRRRSYLHQDFGLFRMRRAHGLSSFTKQ